MRKLALATAIVISLIILSGCKNDDLTDRQGILRELEDSIYVAQTVPFPSDIGDIYDLAYNDGKVYVAAINYSAAGGEDPLQYYSAVKLYSMNIDGTDFQELASYAPLNEKPDGKGGSVYIHEMTVDNDGNLWVVEGWDYYEMDLPDGFDMDDDDPWRYTVITDSGYAVRKLSAEGEDVISVDISNLSMQQGFYFRTFTVCGDSGNESIH